MVLVLYSYLLKDVILPLRKESASIVQITWQNMKRAFLVSATIDLGIKSLNVFGDSALVIIQIKGEWDTKHPNLIPTKNMC